MGDTLFIGRFNDEVWRLTDFTTTVTAQFDTLAGAGTDAFGVSVDSNGDTLVLGGGTIYKYSGTTTTVLDSFSGTGSDTAPREISWDGTNVLMAGNTNDTLYKFDGFSTTELDSVDVGGVETNPQGMSWDEENGYLIYCGVTTDLYRRLVGWTTTENDNVGPLVSEGSPQGCSWDGTNLLVCGGALNALKKCTGFSVSVSATVDVGTTFTESDPRGIEDWDYVSGLGAATGKFSAASGNPQGRPAGGESSQGGFGWPQG